MVLGLCGSIYSFMYVSYFICLHMSLKISTKVPSSACESVKVSVGLGTCESIVWYLGVIWIVHKLVAAMFSERLFVSVWECVIVSRKCMGVCDSFWEVYGCV